ncbi:MAG: phosphatidylserine decarboxylase family protein [Flavobacteriales bacterium Tduv]
MIHREGRMILRNVFVLIVLIITMVFYLLNNSLAIAFTVFSVILYGFLLFFFRNPVRDFSIKEHEVVAPVDGKVVVVECVFEPEFLKSDCIQVSIFMSPLNVHVTRYPVSGKVIYSKYHPGKYLLAWHPKSSTKNERTTVAVETESTKRILFRQIAGFLARRIVLYAKEGDKAEAGKEFGFIKFGSRLDVFFPLDTDISVKVGQNTVGAKTIIAYLA